jgi:hypothetical protein
MTPELWAALRQRMLRETEAFIDDGLRHPERCIVIPARKVGESMPWSTAFASVFWSQVLASS